MPCQKRISPIKRDKARKSTAHATADAAQTLPRQRVSPSAKSARILQSLCKNKWRKRQENKIREPYMIRDLIKQTFGDITISTATTEAFIYTLANNCYPFFVFFYNCTRLHMNKIQIFSTRTCQQSRKRRWNRVPKRGRDSRDGRKQGRLRSKTYVFTFQLDNLGPSILTKKKIPNEIQMQNPLSFRIHHSK